MAFHLIGNNILLLEDFREVNYQSLRLPDERIKLPSSECHIQKFFVYCVDITKYTSLLPGCAMLIGYFPLLRPTEIGY